MTEYNLILITAVFCGLTVVFFVAKKIIAPPLRRRRLQTRPVDLFFAVTSVDKTILGYVEQDEKHHKTVDLTVPSHTEDLYIQLLMHVNLAFTQTEVVFGFDGAADTYPLIRYWSLGFIKIGVR